jgi:thiamine-monophosphate kinase
MLKVSKKHQLKNPIVTDCYVLLGYLFAFGYSSRIVRNVGLSKELSIRPLEGTLMVNKLATKLLSDFGEFELIQLIQEELGNSGSNDSVNELATGIGDDCAVVIGKDTDGENLWRLYTTDSLVEDVHFSRAFASAESVGWKLGATSLSDIAAMGGIGDYLLISLQLPTNLELSWVTDLYLGLKEVSQKFSVKIIGGNISRAEKISVTATAIGHSTKAPLLRSGAQVGDDLWISGEVGLSASGLELLQEGVTVETAKNPIQQKSITAHLKPYPHLALGKELLEQGLASAMIDISDGLFQDAEHLAEASNVDLVFNQETFPVLGNVSTDNLAKSLTGGEDYQLLFTASSKNRAEIEKLNERFSSQTFGLGGEVNLLRIGQIVSANDSSKGRVLVEISGQSRSELSDYLRSIGDTRDFGYQHFKNQNNN